MEVRRRQASTSTQHSHDERTYPPGKGSGSATPQAEEDEEPGSRRTRGRNPLPPTTGPLFPPLPPKQPKASPKSISRSPANRTPRLASASALANAMDDGTSTTGSADGPRPAAARPPTPKRNSAASAGSLSPPPADGDEAASVSTSNNNDGDDKGDSAKPADGDDWDAYRRGRGVRGFSGPKAQPPPPLKIESAENGTTTDGGDSKNESDKNKENGSSNTNNAAAEPPSASTETSASNSAEPGARARRRRGEEQLLLDDHLLPKEMRVHPPRREKASKRSATVELAEPVKEEKHEEPEKEEEAEEAEAEDGADEYDEDDDSSEITRCVCKREDIEVMMIQCDKCMVWQHGECMGIWGDEEAPDEYFCEECRPDLHVPLRKWIRSRGRNPANFVAPTPADLQNLHSTSDKHPPSQSKRWTDPELMDPPPPPPKPPSRSHHKKDKEKEKEKDKDKDDDSNDRSRRGRAKETSGGRERERERDRSDRGAASNASATTPKEATRDSKRRNRRVSTDLSLSTSPPPGRPEPKKRSTMNSRDAAYEEAVKAALEASRREMSGPLENEPAAEEPRSSKRRRADDDEGAEEVKKTTKKKKEEDDSAEASAAAAPSKPKHPNQYTYRPKAGASSTPARRGAGTPQPSAPPPVHEHGTRRAAGIANNLAAAPYTQVSIYNLNWYLPEHLTQFSDLLPTPNPEPLVVPTPRSLQFLPRNHFIAQSYGPFSEEKNEHGKLIMPEDQPLRATDGEAVNHREPPTRVRYPVKRITSGEMHKRVRNMLEYVGRVQLDETRRAERARLIKIPAELPARPPLPSLEDELNGISRSSRSADPEGDVEMKEPTPEAPRGPPPPSSSQLLDELTRDLIAFQEAFQTGDFESLSFVAPPPPPFQEPVRAKSEPEAEEVEAQPEPEADKSVEAEPIEAEAEAAAEAKSASAEHRSAEDQSEPMDIETDAPTNSAKGSEEPRPKSTVSEPEVKPEVTPEAEAPVAAAATETLEPPAPAASGEPPKETTPAAASEEPVVVSEIVSVSSKTEPRSVVETGAPATPEEGEVVEAPVAVTA